MRSDLFIELPAEAGAPEGHVGHLVKSLYGLRYAPKAFERKVQELMLGMGFAASPQRMDLRARGAQAVVRRSRR